MAANPWLLLEVLDSNRFYSNACAQIYIQIHTYELMQSFWMSLIGPDCQKYVGLIKAICSHISSIEPQLTEMDNICGDGDCGLVMKVYVYTYIQIYVCPSVCMYVLCMDAFFMCGGCLYVYSTGPPS